MSKERELLKKILATGWLNNTISCEVEELLAQPEQVLVAIDENTSDGYHTFKELYEFRKAYNVALFNEWGATGKCHTHKSWRHNDGELCFGGGWFIVVAVLPQGQISNHYEAKYWDLFSIQEVEKALFEFDGHTGADVIERLHLYTSPPKREPLSEDEIYVVQEMCSDDVEFVFENLEDAKEYVKAFNKEETGYSFRVMKGVVWRKGKDE